MKQHQSGLMFLLLCGFLLCFSACRKDNEDTLVHLDPDEFTGEDRTAIGARLEEIMLSQAGTYNVLDRNSQNRVVYEYLETLFTSLVNTDVVNHREDLIWGIKILNDADSRNAFITPGGTFYITTGLLKFIQSEHEIISVMGHEIMYADGDYLMNKLELQFGGDILYDIVLGNDPLEIADIAFSLQEIKYAESEVLEADIYSIDIICDFLYDPHGMKDILNRIVADGEQLTWTTNRPSSDDRIQIIQQSAGGCGPGNAFQDRYIKHINMLP